MSQFRNQLLPFLETARPTYLEYIESTGTQWIDTGVTAAANMKVSVTFQYMLQTIEGYDKPIVSFKKEGIGWTDCLSIGMSSPNRGLYLYGDTAGALLISGVPTQKLTKVVVIDSSGNPTVDGVGPNNPIDYGGISLFQNANPDRNFIGKIYSCQIYDGTTMVRNFRPCLSGENGEPCMWDTVTQKYYYNAGTGKFKYEKTFLELDYIQSDGNQYINTGIQPLTARTQKFELGTQYVYPGGTFNYSGIFGTSGSSWWGKTDIKSETRIGIQFGGSSTETIITVDSIYNYHEIELNTGGSCSMDGKSYSLSVGTSGISSSTPQMQLFKINENPATNPTTARAKLFYFRYFNSNILITDYLPVYRFDGTICLYDFITGTYFTNQGTGYFKGQFTDRGKVYEILPYIQGTGNAYIDTGISVHGDYRIKMNITTGTLSANYAWFGGGNGNSFSQGEIALFYNLNSSQSRLIEFVAPSSNSVSSVALQAQGAAQDNTYYTFEIYDSALKKINNTDYNVTYYKDYISTRPMYIFAANRGASTWAGGNQTKLHYWRMQYRDTGVQQELVPVRSRFGLGTYDTVSKQVLYVADGTTSSKASTGSFITYASELPSGYTELQYIQTSGTSYINTGIFLNGNSAEVCLTATYPSGSTATFMFGAQNAPNNTSMFLIYDNALYMGSQSFISMFLSTTDLSTVTVYASNGDIYVGKNRTLLNHYTGSFASTSPYILCGGYSNRELYLSGPMKLGRVILCNNENVVFSGIPCKNSSNIAGMYDMVSGTFKRSDSSTDFTAGPVVTY